MGEHFKTLQVLTILLGGVICLITFEMIRRDLLRTAYALLWLASGVAVVLIGVFSDGFFYLVQDIGMSYQSFILFCVFGFALILMMQYSIIISRLSNRNKHLTQDVAILREELRLLRDQVAPGSTPPARPAKAPSEREET